jgi:predicted ATPase
VVALLRARWPEIAQQQPELLAQHLTEAGQHRDALAQWELAGRRAAARSAQLEAISHLRRALAVLAKLDRSAERDRVALRLQLLLAAQLLATEGYGADAVLTAYQEAERLCDSLGDDTSRFKVEMGLGAYRFMRADFALALDHGQRAAAIATGASDVKQRLQAHWSTACVLFHQGRLRATMREMETALSIYVPAMHAQFGLQDPGIMCMAYSSWGLWELGRPDAALARISQAVSIADAYQHRFSQAVALSYAVSVELLRGETMAALARAERCAQVCDEHGFPVWLAITRCMRGYLQCELGQFERGLPEMNAGYAQWLGTGARVSQPLYLALQARGLMLAGDLAAAEARVDEGLAIVEQLGERQLEAELTRLRGVQRLQRGATAEGEGWLRRAYAIALRQHRLGFALRSATDLARLWVSQGREEAALRLLAPLAARWREGRDTRDVKAAETLIASLQPRGHAPDASARTSLALSASQTTSTEHFR